MNCDKRGGFPVHIECGNIDQKSMSYLCLECKDIEAAEDSASNLDDGAVCSEND